MTSSDKTLKIYIPRDAAAVSVGADELVSAFEAEAQKRKLAIEIIRPGSRGLLWLEPMIEVATPQGRVAFGPVTTADVASVLDAMPPMARTRCGSVSRTRFPG